MDPKLPLTVAIVVCGAVILLGQSHEPVVVYTAAQAAAGRTAYRSSCGKCHLDTLAGRKGVDGELPPVSSLPPVMREVVDNAGGVVPPLTGEAFMKKWPTTKELAHRIKDAVGGFPPENRDGVSHLILTAYILQANGAPAGTEPLTPETSVELRMLATQAKTTPAATPH